MNKEEYKFKVHKYRTLKRSILQKDNINLWKRLELYQKEEDKPRCDPDAHDYGSYNWDTEEIKTIFNAIDNEIKKII